MGSAAGLGLRVKTGRAIAVAVTGDLDRPELCSRRELSLWDTQVPDSAQPYHAGLGLPPADAELIVDRASNAVRLAARDALASLIAELAAQELEVIGVALVRASATDPSTIKNPHMHAHAAEGWLFHDSVVQAAKSLELHTCSLLVSEAARDAARALGRREATLERSIAALGKRVGPPWRADEKAACAAALLALSRGS